MHQNKLRSRIILMAFFLSLNIASNAQFAKDGPKLIGSVGGAAGESGIGFGRAIAFSADGNTAVIGASSEQQRKGVVYVFNFISGAWVQNARIILPGNSSFLSFGLSVDISADGNTFVGGSSGGGAFVFVKNGSTWSQQGAALVPPDGTGIQWLGYASCISGDGNTILFGGFDYNTLGKAWIYTRSGTTWTQQGPTLVGAGAVGNAWQGTSVALSFDGNTAAVGGSEDDGHKGAVWVYTRSGSTWTQQGNKLSGTNSISGSLGTALDISADGNTIVAGGDRDNGDVGAVWVFTRSGSTWSQQGAKLMGNDVVGDARQGLCVSVSGDGNTLAFGGFTDNGGSGAAWIFTRSGSVWTQQGPKMYGSDSPVEFGIAISLSPNGNRLGIAAPGAGSDFIGNAWMYSRSGNSWLQNGPPLAPAGAYGSANQGTSVAVSDDGNTIIEGGKIDNGNIGAAWIFQRSGGLWTQAGAKLIGAGRSGLPRQGSSVAISGDGNTAIVGGPNDNSNLGAVWVYVRNGNAWEPQGPKLAGTGGTGTIIRQGFSLALSADGNTAAIGANADNTNVGAVWIFTRTAGVWTQQGSKLVGTGAVGASAQGSSVSLSADGNTLVVGGSGDNAAQGAAWIFTRTAGVWTQLGNKLVGTGATGNANQGSSVDISGDGNTLVSGGYLDNSGAGATWIFTRSGSVWSQQGNKLIGTGATGLARQGINVSVSNNGNKLAVGGSFDNNKTGASWIFTRSGSTWSQEGNKLVGDHQIGPAEQATTISLSGNADALVVGGPFDEAGWGCVYTFRVNSSLPPTATISGTATVCQNAASPNIVFTGSNGQPPYTFSYQLNGGSTQTITTTSGSAVNLPAPTNTMGTFVYTLISVSDNTAASQLQNGSATITVNAAVEAGAIAGTANVCPYIGSAQQLTYSISAIAGVTNYIWTIPPTLTLVSGQGTNSIVVTIGSAFIANTNKSIKVRVVSQCGTSADKSLALKATAPAKPGVITGPVNACPYLGTGVDATYTINAVAGATSYTWTSQAGTTTIHHTNGNGSNDTTVTVSFANGFSASPISVQAVNSCGTSAERALTINRTTLTRPSSIAGPTNVCPYVLPNVAVAQYSVNRVAGATSYAWTVPAGCIVTHPQGTGSEDFVIGVQFPNTFATGTVSVTASGECGTTTPLNLTVRILKAGTPGAITPTVIAACPNRVYRYALAAIPSNTNTIEWTVPAGANIISGAGTSSIDVSYPNTAVSGAVTARAVNECSSSSVRSLSVSLPVCPGFFVKGKGSTTDLSGEINIMLFPNPTAGAFKMQVSKSGSELIVVRIVDLQGRKIKEFGVMPGQTISFGEELKSGIYLMELMQGKVRIASRKLIKL